MTLLIIKFIACSAFIVYSGTKLSRYGDIIAEKSGLGKAWVGLIMMATITSLPELITGISAVTLVNAPNLAMGDILGSCIYNLAILVMMDMASGHRPLFVKASRTHILSAGMSIALLCIVALSMITTSLMPSISHIGLYTPVIIVTYIVGARLLYTYEKSLIAEYVTESSENIPAKYEDITLKTALIHYGINAGIIIIAATYLPFIADGISKATGLGHSFMGSVFVAMTTSLPEVVVSISAIRIGAVDMAIANMLGSNMFNILVLAIDDIFYTKGPILSHIDSSHLITTIMAILMTSIAIIGLIFRPKKKKFIYTGWDTLLILILWGISMYLLFMGA